MKTLTAMKRRQRARAQQPEGQKRHRLLVTGVGPATLTAEVVCAHHDEWTNMDVFGFVAGFQPDHVDTQGKPMGAHAELSLPAAGSSRAQPLGSSVSSGLAIRTSPKTCSRAIGEHFSAPMLVAVGCSSTGSASNHRLTR